MAVDGTVPEPGQLECLLDRGGGGQYLLRRSTSLGREIDVECSLGRLVHRAGRREAVRLLHRPDGVHGRLDLARRRIVVAESVSEVGGRLVRSTPKNHQTLRPTAASLAVSAGANVKAVQRMLGHISASMTIDASTLRDVPHRAPRPTTEVRAQA